MTHFLGSFIAVDPTNLDRSKLVDSRWLRLMDKMVIAHGGDVAVAPVLAVPGSQSQH